MVDNLNLLTRDEILGADDIQEQIVPVPEWGGAVRVRALTGQERDVLESHVVRTRRDGSTAVNTRNLRARLLTMCCIDEDGARIFDEADVEALGAKSAGALDRVFSVAQKLSGLSPGDVEDLVKN
jgi:hypothetical protein